MLNINASALQSAMMGGNKFREGWSARTTVSEQRRTLREFFKLCDRAVVVWRVVWVCADVVADALALTLTSGLDESECAYLQQLAHFEFAGE